MPDYRTLIGDMVPPPPFLHQNVTLNAMFFDADPQTLAGYLSTTFNRLAGVSCEILSNAVMLVTLYADEVRPTDARYDRRDGISEIDCGFWALVRCSRNGGSSGLFWTPLCLFVDSVFALVIGRELYGFPKMLGAIQPTEPATSADLSVEVRTDHFQSVGERHRMIRNTPLFAVVREDSLTIPVENVDLVELKRQAYQQIFSETKTSPPIKALAEPPGFPYLDMPMLFLRQLRAIRNTPASAYSAVTTANMTPTAPPRIELVKDDTLRLLLSPSRNLPLSKLIGIKSGAKARLPFRAHFDFVAGEGEDI